MPTKQTLFQSILMVLLVPATFALAQSGGDAKDSQDNVPWIGVITSTSAEIRCGANESYYTIATANMGDFVRVHGKQRDWMKIDTSGGVFKNTIGYIKYPTSETTLFETSENSGTAKGELEVLAKNTGSEELYRSWRPILRLHDGDSVTIIESMITEPGTLHRDAYVVHTIQMPATATGWVNATHIARATTKQLAAFSGTTETVAYVGDTDNDSLATEGDPTNDTPDEDSTTLEPLTLVELEAAWEKISADAVMGAEVLPLKDMYVELLSGNGDDLVIEQIAGGRIKQLGVWAELQNQRIRIESLKSRLVEETEEVTEYQSVMSLYTNYAIAGKLALSNTFDGRLRPFMYRIQDPKSGRTLGYLPGNEDWELSGLVGQTIGVVGNNKWNPNWRVNVVEATRFDILSPATATVTPDIQ